MAPPMSANVHAVPTKGPLGAHRQGAFAGNAVVKTHPRLHRTTPVGAAKCAKAWKTTLDLPSASIGSGGNDGGAHPPLPPTSEAGGGGSFFAAGLPLHLVLLLAAAADVVHPRPAHALFRKKKKKQPDFSIDEYSDRLVTLFWPIAQNLGFSGAIGFGTALALKTVGRALAVLCGTLFVIIQGLAYMGYVTLNWSTVHKDIIRRLDVNHEGKFDASDMKAIAASGLAVLAQGVPSTGGFLAGFALGLK